MLRHGAVLLRGGSVGSPEDFAAVFNSLNFEGYDYIGKAVLRIEFVSGVVFTSFVSPPDQAIPSHHELAQTPALPPYILIFCERSSSGGGATRITSSAEIADFVALAFGLQPEARRTRRAVRANDARNDRQRNRVGLVVERERRTTPQRRKKSRPRLSMAGTMLGTGVTLFFGDGTPMDGGGLHGGETSRVRSSSTSRW